MKQVRPMKQIFLWLKRQVKRTTKTQRHEGMKRKMKSTAKTQRHEGLGCTGIIAMD
ncbi:hypothetical protein K5X82_03165 [Halosquirtibacter xylanolyticus]|uniref:hypothetical protein n=1 Tax=Halosquirtibacter xylanolyticus TaxID=3374599 RepID=UPI00374A2B83|nr:hypothetical protein K5X82_03165 [Prolixibacteraceae bacterium]